MGLKEAFLNKGWAGRTLSRNETIERFNPLIRMLHELNHAYNYTINHISDRDTASRLDAFQKTARTDVAKLNETVLSAGGVAYNGVDINAEDFNLGDEDGPMIHRLREGEEDFLQHLSAELDAEHQIRSRAILSVVQSNSRDRLDYLRSIARQQSQTSN